MVLQELPPRRILQGLGEAGRFGPASFSGIAGLRAEKPGARVPDNAYNPLTFYGDRIFGSIAVQLRASHWVPALLALGFATGFLHYWLDGAVYRLFDPAVRIAAPRLLEADMPEQLKCRS